MKFISVIYISRRNFWGMTWEDYSHLNFQLQKVDWEPSGRQNQGKMIEFWKILYIHFIRDPKGITYARFILKIESDAKMRLASGMTRHIYRYIVADKVREYRGKAKQLNYHMFCIVFIFNHRWHCML